MIPIRQLNSREIRQVAAVKILWRDSNL